MINCWDILFDHHSVISKVLANWTTIHIPISVILIAMMVCDKEIFSNNAVLMYIGRNSNYLFLIHYVVIMYVKRLVNLLLPNMPRSWILVIIVSAIMSIVFTEAYKKAVYIFSMKRGLSLDGK